MPDDDGWCSFDLDEDEWFDDLDKQKRPPQLPRRGRGGR